MRSSLGYPAATQSSSNSVNGSTTLSSLKPPTSTNTNRISIGFWGASKSAASTPNLSQLTNVANNNTFDIGPYPPVIPPASGKESTKGSTADAIESIASGKEGASNSFQQRRKRSESIGGLKNFEDKDAPPIPVIPQQRNGNPLHPSTSSLSINSTPSFVGSMVAGISDLPLITKDNSGYGPLDSAKQEPLPETTSDSNGNPVAAYDIPARKTASSDQVALDQELSRSASTVESWLRSSRSDMDTTSVTTQLTNGSISTPPVSSASTAATSTVSSEATTPPNIRRPSHISVVSTEDGEEYSDTEQGSESAAQPIGSARLSLMYESGSIHLNQPQTSFYFSSPSSQPEEAENPIVKVTPAALTRSSIRFSQYGLLAANDFSLMPDSNGVSSENGSEDKPLPSRPFSMMVSPTHTSVEDDGKLSLDSTPSVAARRMSMSVLQVPEESKPVSSLPPEIKVKFTSHVSESPTPTSPREATDDLAYKTSKRCFSEDESFLRREEISCYLGSNKPFNRRVVTHYMNHFDFGGKRLDGAFRQLCQKLMLKGETQEVDRVLEAFAQRFIDTNPQSIFGSKDVVHAITYSILLLNTDLHVVQQSNSSKMSRSAFVKNTLQVVQSQASQSDRASEDSSTHGLSLTRTETGELSVHDSTHGSGGKRRTPSVKSWRSGTSHQSKSSKMGVDPKANGGHGNGRWWLSELESLLKDIYTTVKHNQILLPSATSSISTTGSPPSSATGTQQSLGKTSSGGFLPRMSRQVQPSALADAGFGNLGNELGTGANTGRENLVVGMIRRNSVNARTKQLRQDAMRRLNAQSSIGSHGPSLSSGVSSHLHQGGNSPSNTVDGVRVGNSRYSLLPPPSASSTPMSQSATSTSTSRQEAPPINRQISQQSVATGNKEVSSGKNKAIDHQPRLQMEGILYRKHLLERPDKKAAHRAWRQLLVVLDQGGLSMFRADGQMGQAFEEQGILLDEIRLQHTITNILPPPGYSSTRRHVFAIQLHTGAVFLFQTATSLECEEWARTCNYWAARTSKEPLSGGVVNMDYGWGRCLDLLEEGESNLNENGYASSAHNHSLTASSSSSSIAAHNNSSGVSLPILNVEEDETNIKGSTKPSGSSFLNFPPPVSSGGSSHSTPVQPGGYDNGPVSGGRTASIKSSSSKHFGPHNVPLGDRVPLFDWVPPIPSLSMVQMSEEEQCENLKRQVIGLESEMEFHQERRVPMMKLFLPKSHNYTKAFNNWERRSRYLLKEMVKYQIYVECLEQSIRFQAEARGSQNAKAEVEVETKAITKPETESTEVPPSLSVDGVTSERPSAEPEHLEASVEPEGKE
ncbi:hypothetical protein FBU30_001827 [Linnemannia zychae]|nr:hypothetical protein FBU30_001827 [Linnemannia zychae]